MDDAARVCGRDGVRDRNRDAQQLVQAQSLPRDDRVERGAAHVLHDDEVDGAFRLDMVNRDDVRMVEGGGGLRFLEKAAPAAFVVHPVGRQDLDGDLAAEARIAGPIHFAHPARANRCEHFVDAEPRSGGKRRSAAEVTTPK